VRTETERVSTAAEHTSASSRPCFSITASKHAATSPSLVTSTVIASLAVRLAYGLSARMVQMIGSSNSLDMCRCCGGSS